MQLGQRIRSVRRSLDLTLRDLSEKADLSLPYLSDIERGAVNPSIKSLVQIANAFDMSLATLVAVVDFGYGIPQTKRKQEVAEQLEKKAEGVVAYVDPEWVEIIANIQYKGRTIQLPDDMLLIFLMLQRMLAPDEMLYNQKPHDPYDSTVSDE